MVTTKDLANLSARSGAERWGILF